MSLPVVAIMMACFNRKAKTLECLSRLKQLKPENDYSIEMWVIDDGSTDGTADAIEQQHPDVHVIKHAGGLFWNRAMHLLFSEVRSTGRASYYVWLNDDTMLHPGALRQLLAVAESRGGPRDGVIVVGATSDVVSGQVTYSGHKRLSGWMTLRTKIMMPSDTEVLNCDTFNGNFVLISKGAVERVGLLDPAYEHGMGDLDYGLRARRQNIKILLAPGFVGTCSRNSIQGTFEDVNLPFKKRWSAIKSPKGLPPRSWFRFTFRHGGGMAPLLFAWPYFKTVISSTRLRKFSR